MEKKTILVLCGAGFATSTVGAKMAEDVCKEIGVKGNVQKRPATQGKTAIKQLKPDAILLMAKLTLDFGDIPVVNGIPLITGREKDKVKQELIHALTK
ncbi:MAG: PTS galactitol transporter subunit IIB [Anaerostipes sp.]|jgi:PTS system galactitol-specific IIB component|nr:PTS galactitol transporter subunit IIB [Anaerostipes sp.]MDD3745996.1 PTS galactitol transporter subunit IIB [Anaerostipes sp.]